MKQRQTEVCRTFRRTAFALFLLAAVCLLPFNRQAQTTKEERIATGAKIFRGGCSSSYCHGGNGSGGGGPALRNRKLTAESLTKTISEGVKSTPMPAFKDVYSRAEITNIVAYILSLSAENAAELDALLKAQAPRPETAAMQPAPATPVVNIPADPDNTGDAAAGRELFFGAEQTTNCRVCHTFRGRGGAVGPDLTDIAAKPVREIIQSITAPNAAVAEKYAAVALVTRAGQRYASIKRDEEGDTIRIYDTSSLPPVSRAFRKTDVASIEKLNESGMPGNYAARYSPQQLLDLAAFLKSQ